MDVVRNKVAAYLLLGEDLKRLKAQQDQLKTELEPYLADAEVNSRGSRVLRFDSPLAIGNTQYGSLQKVRKVSKTLDEEKVFAWLADLNPEVYKDWGIVRTREYIDQDALWNIFTLDLIDQGTFDSFFHESESWAFSPTKV